MNSFGLGACLAFGFVLGAGQASAAGPSQAMAKVGAEAAGYNYQNGVICKAPADLLDAFKAKKRATFAAAGAEFEPAFAAGRADASSKWNRALTVGFGVPVPEATLRQSLCVDGAMVAKMRAALAKK